MNSIIPSSSSSMKCSPRPISTSEATSLTSSKMSPPGSIRTKADFKGNLEVTTTTMLDEFLHIPQQQQRQPFQILQQQQKHLQLTQNIVTAAQRRLSEEDLLTSTTPSAALKSSEIKGSNLLFGSGAETILVS